MTVRAYMDRKDLTRIDVNNKIDPKTGVRYLGYAWCDVATGRWLCLADVGALCVVEVRLVVDGEATTPIGDVTPAGDDAPAMKIVSCTKEVP